ncbi:sialidase family protein [Actinoplanes sp. Pm04-4]|uniref:Sialidase family protein n=1 Tax=Paractinoplanes pyxinae TaxID=2997416 RepID=A0ABT4BF54_9ACTN|nr:sialidase family protein [Actinoplanes pyxinae]MCY1145081.1 sialidase family protein [Actinoplanes pyxinae]
MPTPFTVARAEDGLLAHFPDIVKLADGRLLAGYREGTAHVRSDGRLTLVESADGGETWSEPRVVVDGEWDDRDPKLGVLADGTVLLSYFVINWSTNPPLHSTYGTFVRRSTDGGRTWSDDIPVGTNMIHENGRYHPAVPTFACSHGAATQLPNGDVLLPLYGRLPGRKWMQATVVRSTDGGLTWPAESEVLLAEDEAGGVHYQEPTLTLLDDGELVALIRTTENRAYITRSSDNGHTWTEKQPTDMPAQSHHALALSSGEVLVTYGDLSSRWVEHRETVGRLVRDPRKTWDGYEDVQLYDSGHSDQANPSSVEVEPGRFLTLGFDVNEATVIGFFTTAADYRS